MTYQANTLAVRSFWWGSFSEGCDVPLSDYHVSLNNNRITALPQACISSSIAVLEGRDSVVLSVVIEKLFRLEVDVDCAEGLRSRHGN